MDLSLWYGVWTGIFCGLWLGAGITVLKLRQERSNPVWSESALRQG